MKQWFYRTFIDDSRWMAWVAGTALLIFLIFMGGCAPLPHGDESHYSGYPYGSASAGPTYPPPAVVYTPPPTVIYAPPPPPPPPYYREWREWRYPAGRYW